MSKILLVEDERDAADLLATNLGNHGYEVRIAYNGVEALKILQEERFDLAIVDLIMPDMNGMELCGMIRHDIRFRNLPIIISTALDDEDTHKKSKDLGISDFLSKPYSVKVLISAIERILEARRG